MKISHGDFGENGKSDAQVALDVLVRENFEYLGIVDVASGTFRTLARNDKFPEFDEITDDYDLGVRLLLESWRDRFVGDDEFDQVYNKVSLDNVLSSIKGKNTYGLRIEILSPDKKSLSTYRNTYSFIDEDQQQILIRFRDITQLVEDEKKYQEVLKLALLKAEQLNKTKTNFLSRMSHEIRVPLNSILGMAAIASNCKDNPGEVEDCIEKIQISAKYMADLVNDILDMSRLEKGKSVLKCAPFNFAQFLDSVESVSGNMAEKCHIRFSITRQGNFSQNYIGDVLKLEQILTNLISNGIKFNDPGGYVNLSVEKGKTTLDKTEIIFKVTDDGHGIEKSFLPYVFQPFEQEEIGVLSEYEGNGLGLYICKNLTEILGGDIHVESKIGEGTVFTLSIALDNEERHQGDAVKSNVAEEKYDFSGKRALLAEDNALNAEVAKRLLEAKGMQVDVVENGLEAIEKFTAEREGTYNLIIMDVRMPIMDGLTATTGIRRMAREDANNVPIIAMSANAFDEDKEKSKAAGMDYHITKPIDPKSFYKIVKQFVEA